MEHKGTYNNQRKGTERSDRKERQACEAKAYVNNDIKETKEIELMIEYLWQEQYQHYQTIIRKVFLNNCISALSRIHPRTIIKNSYRYSAKSHCT